MVFAMWMLGNVEINALKVRTLLANPSPPLVRFHTLLDNPLPPPYGRTYFVAGVGDTRIFSPDSDTDTLSNTRPIPRPILIPVIGTIRFQYRY